VRVVRAFVRDRHERQRFAAANDELLSVGLRAGRLQALMFPTVLVLWQLTTVALVYVGAHRIDSGALQPGGLVAFLGYLLQTSMSVMMVLFLLMHMPRAQAGAERVREVLDTRSSVVPPVFPVRAPETTPCLTAGTLAMSSSRTRTPYPARSPVRWAPEAKKASSRAEGRACTPQSRATAPAPARIAVRSRSGASRRAGTGAARTGSGAASGAASARRGT
ncbi:MULTISPECIES: ABC transporter transmembrane domain-containing protein, partial [Streptomyces]|uniref:ABC transporter transmembrane domain-containing protein n=1 Tax=Streptomyces TaxID=1883 RepID=UPI00227718D4